MNSLVDFRNSKNLKQREMANILGVSLTFYSKIETGVRNPSYNFLLKFKSIFNEANVDEIFFNDLQHIS
ncbi:XRE family transcriptional regulator [Romboutsia maritimum]|uniref:XRE family transcriptional regulator n=1 Tax=Romboutsia maritimum TaxID=2020948 RepID=A0A371IQT3_9FIRM|nr:helix-turn-helix transcriptional regulator [Romboutsia maritimum]RDY22847.1 XRE family transcriptional regulator [Romboutsia maritimum]